MYQEGQLQQEILYTKATGYAWTGEVEYVVTGSVYLDHPYGSVGAGWVILIRNETVVRSSDHCHLPLPTPALNSVHVMKQKLKACPQTSVLPTKHLVANAVGPLTSEALMKVNCKQRSYGKLARSARAKVENHPVNPKSLSELVLPPNYIKTMKEDCFLLWDSTFRNDLRRSLMFGSPENINILATADHVIIDGTFKTSPQLFHQMVTVHGIFRDIWNIPLLFALLRGKTQTHYEELFQKISDFGIKPSSVLCDYKKAMINAVKKTWSNTTPRGCFFHMKKALWRNMQFHNLMPEYQIDGSPVRIALNMIGGLAFVHLDDVQSLWNMILQSLPDCIESFKEYLERTWIGNQATPSVFPPEVWNHHNSVVACLPRTTNIAEGYHHAFLTLMGCKHPSI